MERLFLFAGKFFGLFALCLVPIVLMQLLIYGTASMNVAAPIAGSAGAVLLLGFTLKGKRAP